MSTCSCITHIFRVYKCTVYTYTCAIVSRHLESFAFAVLQVGRAWAGTVWDTPRFGRGCRTLNYSGQIMRTPIIIYNSLHVGSVEWDLWPFSNTLAELLWGDFENKDVTFTFHHHITEAWHYLYSLFTLYKTRGILLLDQRVNMHVYENIKPSFCESLQLM